jgi:bacterioferritin-associated ferredoxin
MAVDRCYCTKTTFARLIALHESTGRAFEELARETGCASQCGLCEPYARAALATGRAELPVSTASELLAIVRQAQDAVQKATAAAPETAPKIDR